MKIFFNILLLITWFFAGNQCTPSRQNTTDTVNIILDTDIGPDYDDVGAMALLHTMADSGRVKILATMASNKDSLVVPTIEVLNRYFGRQELPVGSPKSGGASFSSSSHWPDSIVSRFPHQTASSRLSADAVPLYRKVLASQPDHSVTIVTIGFLTNLANLLQTAPDEGSPLNGLELVTLKVKSLVSMAGWFPAGREYNVYVDSAASKYCFEHWPTEITFTGFEIGDRINTGLRLISNSKRDNPVSEAYRIAMSGSKEDSAGHKSWDQTAVLIAIYGTMPFFTSVKGTILVHPDGSNSWMESPDGRHSFVGFKMNPDSLATFIENRMMLRPDKFKSN